ncbi:hypothetical protein QYF36_008398 [Acer negundo]|nr:hypothetical protein QYF36_008398 [Acer negundo]
MRKATTNPQELMQVGAIMEDEEEKKEEEEIANKIVPFCKLLSYADGLDWTLMVMGTLGSVVHGMAQPIGYLLLGKALQAFGNNVNDKKAMVDALLKVVPFVWYMAFATFPAGILEIGCWMYTSERQLTRMRLGFLKALLNQEIGAFDTDLTNGKIITGVSNHMTVIQDAIGEKLGHFLSSFATFFSGVLIAAICCWEVALLTFFVVPLILVIGATYTNKMNTISAAKMLFLSDAASMLEQTITQIKTVFAFVGESTAIKSFSGCMEKQILISKGEALIKGVGTGMLQSVSFCSWALIIWVGAVVVAAKKSNGGDVLAAIMSILFGAIAITYAAPDMQIFNQAKAAGFEIFQFLRKNLGAVSQEPSLFAGNIKDNIRVGNMDADDQQIENAAKMANAHTFISHLPDQYLTENLDQVHDDSRAAASNVESISSHQDVLNSEQYGSEPNSFRELNESTKQEEVKRKEKKTIIFFRIWFGLKQRELVKLVIGSIAAAFSGISKPVFGFYIITIGVAYYNNDPKIHVGYYSLIFSLIGLFSLFTHILQHYFFGVVGEKAMINLRKALHTGVLRNEIAWFEKQENDAGSLTSRIMNDTSMVKTIISDRMSVIVQCISSILIATIVSMIANWRMALVAWAVMPCHFIGGLIQAKSAKGFSGDSAASHNEFIALTSESAANIRTIASFCHEEHILGKAKVSLEKPKRNCRKASVKYGIIQGFSLCLWNIAHAVALWYTAILIDRNQAKFKNGIRAYQIFSLTVPSITELWTLIPMVISAISILTPAFEILDRKTEIEPDEPESSKRRIKGRIEFQNVKFNYPLRPEVTVLNNFNLQIEPGLRKPAILLLDEATSALDAESEGIIVNAMESLYRETSAGSPTQTTQITVAHRLSTVVNSDTIVVMDKGEIVEMGSHSTLVAETEGVYSRLYKLQSFKQN